MLHNSMRLATVVMVLSLCGVAQQAPTQLQPPANEQLLFEVRGKGDQIYTCATEGSRFVWALKGPEAKLFDKDGKVFGRHFIGPSWKAKDGSLVVGKPIADALAPDGNSVPWLLVKVVSHDGNGVLSHVTTIQRLNTSGGKAPASGCDETHVGKDVHVPYSADYLFYAPK
jgi:hypothetical protein